MIGLLRPFLDCKHQLFDERRISIPSGYEIPPWRVCDYALDRILAILDGSPSGAYAEARRRRYPERRTPITALRDEMIADLNRRLGGTTGIPVNVSSQAP
jgi:hypothetical protein